MKNNNEHMFSEEYNEKKTAIIDCLEKTQTKQTVSFKNKPVKVLAAVAALCVVMTTTLFAVNEIEKQKYAFNTAYLPEGVDEIVSPEERFEIEGFPSLEYYIQDLDGEEFAHWDEQPPENSDGIEYEVFSVNGHYAQIIEFVSWESYEDFDEYTNKQLIVHFEEEGLLVQVWATNTVSVEELKKVAEGLSLEPTDDEAKAVKVYLCD